MRPLVQSIHALPQSGKTTAAAAMMLGYTAIGIAAAFITSREAHAHDVAKRFGFPTEHSFGWSRRLVSSGLLLRYDAIILDNVNEIESSDGDPLVLVASRFATRHAWARPTIFGFHNVMPDAAAKL
jgi:hypothetical protein